MGCKSIRVDPINAENPLRFIISMVSRNICYSRKNLKFLEPLFYYLNLLLEKVVRKKIVSDSLIKTLNELEMNLTLILQENSINDSSFFNYLTPIQNASQILYPDTNFNFHAKIEAIEYISNSLDVNFLKDFFLNDSAQFWLNNFGDKNSTTWELFFVNFIATYQNFFEKDHTEEIKSNLLILMKYYLQSNNDLVVTKEGWNAFSFKRMADFDMRWKMIEQASYTPIKVIKNWLLMSYFYEEEKILEQTVEYHISEKGLEYNSFDQLSKNKDMTSEFITFGRHPENDVRFSNQSVSRNHFYVSMKKNLINNEIRNEFFVNNISSFYIYFPVEAEGYLLAKKMIINLAENTEFFIKDMYPPFKPINGILSIEPEFTDTERKPLINTSDSKPFIEIQSRLGNPMNQRFEVVSKNQDFTISIGSGEHDTLILHDEDESIELILENHCYFKYDSINECWIIQDRSVVQPGNKQIYKTLIRCDMGEYEGLDEKYSLKIQEGYNSWRGIKLVSRMKIYFSENVIEIQEKEGEYNGSGKD